MAGLLSTNTIPLLEQMVNFTETRHQILASNIANMDVPGYRSRDLSVEKFQAQLKEAIAAGQRPTSSAAHGHGGLDAKPELNNILYHDDSNISLENQVAEIAKNQAQHNLALTIMNSQFRLLQAAISERV